MLKRILTEDKNIQLIQDNVDQALSPLQGSPLSSGTLLSTQTNANKQEVPIAITSGQDNLIQHRLGRQIQYWIVSELNVSATIWSPATSKLSNSAGTPQSSNSSYLNLWCSSNCTVSLVVG